MALTKQLYSQITQPCVRLVVVLSIFLMPALSSAYVNLAKQVRADYYPKYPKPTHVSPKLEPLIKRGEYLAKAGDCISCHTDIKPNSKPFAGGRAMVVPPFGTFYAPNITGDKTTGIGNWTDKQFLNAMRNGVGIHGQNLYPVFPYVYFNKVTPKDLLAIKAYLMSIPRVKQKNKPNKILWPFSMRFLQYGWKVLFFYPDRGVFKPVPTKSPQWNRGAYLVEGLGHCSMCHTPINFLGAPIKSKYLSGNFVEGYWAPNITSAALAPYSIKQIVDVFKQGVLLGGQGEVLGPMSEANHNSLRYLTDDDLAAIAIYLKSVKGIAPKAASTGAITPQAVRNIYDNSCASCHDRGLQGAPILGDEANWKRRLLKGKDTVIRHAIEGYNQMPAKGTCTTCSNAQIRAVTEYMIAKSLPGLHKAPMHVVPTSPITAKSPQRLNLTEGQKIYQQSCQSCHETGKDGAPKFGDTKTWDKLVADQGVQALIVYAIRGKDGKHVRGGCTHCTNTEIKEAVKYILQNSTSKGDYSLW